MMGRYGRGFRSCCDSPAGRADQPHIPGCIHFKAPAQVDRPGFQSRGEGFESPGGRQSPWTPEDARLRELDARINAKRQIIALLQDEIRQLEERKLT